VTVQNFGWLAVLTVAVGSAGGVVAGGAVAGGAVGGTVAKTGNVVVVVLDDVVVDVVLDVVVDVEVVVVVGGLVVVVFTTLTISFLAGFAGALVPTLENPVTSSRTHPSASASRPTDVPAAMKLRLRDRARCRGVPTSTEDSSADSSDI
jgi:hypothetical protein